MSLRTISLFTYRTRGGLWTAPQLGVLRFVHALKKCDLGGAGEVRVRCGEPTRRLGEENVGDALEWFAEMVVPLLQEELAATQLVLVPIPDSHCIEDVTESRTNAMAVAVARRTTVVVVSDVLRWRQRMASVRSGRASRSPASLYQNLRVRAGWTPIPCPYVLIDDVVTTGGHLRACAAYLRDRGALVERAICAARSDPEPPDDPFQRRIDELQDFKSPSG